MRMAVAFVCVDAVSSSIGFPSHGSSASEQLAEIDEQHSGTHTPAAFRVKSAIVVPVLACLIARLLDCLLSDIQTSAMCRSTATFCFAVNRR